MAKVERNTLLAIFWALGCEEHAIEDDDEENARIAGESARKLVREYLGGDERRRVVRAEALRPLLRKHDGADREEDEEGGRLVALGRPQERNVRKD